MAATNKELWCDETYLGIFRHGYRVTKLAHAEQTPFQKLEIFDSDEYGRIMTLDGCLMTTDRDEFVYHEMIAHVPLFTHPRPRRVLVIGGGDGGTLREVMRHPSVELGLLVEIDERVVETSRQYLPKTSVGLSRPGVRVQCGDGVRFVRETSEKFDVILIDSTDPIGVATPLFGEDFYQQVHRVLSDDGIVVAQGESPFFTPDLQKKMLAILGKFFPIRHLYNMSNISYPGGLWSFLFASKKHCPLKGLDEKRVKASGLSFRYYTPALHRASFVLPQFMLDNCEGLLSPVTG